MKKTAAATFTVDDIMATLREMGTKTTLNTFENHGAQGTSYGVKIGDLKTLQKQIKKNHRLALDLYNTGNSDAMYLAGLIADERQMTKEDLRHWAVNAPWSLISEYTVPWVASESDYGMELGLEWIESDSEQIAAAGWATLASVVSLAPDEQLDKNTLRQLLSRVQNNIHTAQNRVRYTMNSFVIAVGSYVPDLTDLARQTGEDIGKVQVDMGNTSCKVPYAPEYIDKMAARGSLGRKRKQARC